MSRIHGGQCGHNQQKVSSRRDWVLGKSDKWPLLEVLGLSGTFDSSVSIVGNSFRSSAHVDNLALYKGWEPVGDKNSEQSQLDICFALASAIQNRQATVETKAKAISVKVYVAVFYGIEAAETPQQKSPNSPQLS